jgi:hypothetical protein
MRQQALPRRMGHGYQRIAGKMDIVYTVRILQPVVAQSFFRHGQQKVLGPGSAPGRLLECRKSAEIQVVKIAIFLLYQE